MKLAQNQVWKQGDVYLRIVQLERLDVRYKAISNLLAGEGTHHHVSKKEFCRLIKGARLLTQAEVREIWLTSEPSSPISAGS
jgi:pyridoxal biosynthesis lyase PdxS